MANEDSPSLGIRSSGESSKGRVLSIPTWHEPTAWRSARCGRGATQGKCLSMSAVNSSSWCRTSWCASSWTTTYSRHPEGRRQPYATIGRIDTKVKVLDGLADDGDAGRYLGKRGDDGGDAVGPSSSWPPPSKVQPRRADMKGAARCPRNAASFRSNRTRVCQASSSSSIPGERLSPVEGLVQRAAGWRR